MTMRNPYDSDNRRARIQKAKSLKDLVCRVPYASIRDKGSKQDVTKAKSLYDLVRDQKSIAESIIRLEDKLLKLLRRDWYSLSYMADHLGIGRRNVETALGHLKSSGYHIISSDRLVGGRITRLYTLKRF